MCSDEVTRNLFRLGAIFDGLAGSHKFNLDSKEVGLAVKFEFLGRLFVDGVVNHEDVDCLRLRVDPRNVWTTPLIFLHSLPFLRLRREPVTWTAHCFRLEDSLHVLH